MTLRLAACLVSLWLPALGAPAATITVAARAIQPGELIVLTVVTDEPVDALHARAFDRDLVPSRVDARTWRVLVGIDLDVAVGAYPVTVVGDRPGASVRATHQLVVVPKTFPTRTLTVDEAFVNPPAAVQGRIEREARDLAALWASAGSAQLWTGPFLAPVPDPANSAFGSRSVYNGQARSPHTGADFLSAAGMPVKAPNGGRVVLARDLYFTGNTVVIDHGLGLFSILAHLSRIDVHEGDAITTGVVVGLVGATGRVTGPHLHWSVRAGGARVDPLSVLAVLGK